MRAFLIGGNHWDERLIVSRDLHPGESVPIRTIRTPGGAVSNMARTLQGQGVDCTLASVCGHTPPPITGEFVKMIPGETTARYLSLENEQGQVLHGFADMEIYEKHMNADWYRSLIPAAQSADAVVLDCNGPRGALEHVGFFKKMIGLAVSPAKVSRLIPILDRLQVLFCNSAEADVLSVHMSKVAQAVVTNGKAGASIFENGLEIARFAAPDWQPKTANGLGDRLAGLTLAGLMGGKPLDRALPHALDLLPC